MKVCSSVVARAGERESVVSGPYSGERESRVGSR